MTIKEMHDEVALILQRQAANTYSSIEEQDIDRALNRGQIEYINQQFRPMPTKNFQSAQKNLDNLRSIITKNAKLTAVRPSTTGYDQSIYEDNVFYSFLPSDYMYLVNARCNLQKLDKKINCKEVDKVAAAPYKQYISVVNYTLVEEELCTQNPVFRIAFGDNDVFNLQDFGSFNFSNKDAQTKIINLVLEFLNRFNTPADIISYDATAPKIEFSDRITNFNVYWEYYNDKYYPNSFIFVSDDRDAIIDPSVVTPSDSDVDFNTNNEGIEVKLFTNDSGTPTGAMRFQQVSWTTEEINSAEYTEAGQIILANNVPTRKVELEMVYNQLNYVFGNTKPTQPIIAMDTARLYTYTDSRFTVTSNTIDYIRKPRKMSLEFNQSCELSEHTHLEIVNYAALWLLEITSNPRFAQKVQEMQLKNQL